MHATRTTALLAALVVVLAGLTPAAAAERETLFVATDDTYTFAESPGWNVGGQPTAESSSYPRIRSTAWIKFDLSSLPANAVITSATLELTTAWSNRASIDVHTAPSGWKESMTHETAVSYGNRITTAPAMQGTVMASVTGAVAAAAKSVAFALPPSSGERVGYHFRTSESGQPPRLRVEWNAEGAPPPAPVDPIVGDTLWGATIYHKGQTFREGLAKSDALFGKMDMVRVFYPGAPQPWPGNAGYANRPVVVSFKYPMREVLSGQHDSELRRWFAEAPRDREIWWSFHHEPEDDIARGSFSAADYRNAWKRIVGLADQAGNDRLLATLTLMDWTINPLSKRSFSDYYAGDGYIDVLAFDAYNPFRLQSYRDPSVILEPLARLAEQRGKPWGIAEFGALVVPSGSNGSGRAAWMKEYATTASQLGAEFVAYWDSDGRYDHRLLDARSQQAWRDVVSGNCCG